MRTARLAIDLTESGRLSAPWLRLLREFIADEGGQDLIEYALLTVFIGIVAILAWQNIGNSIRTVYTGWDGGVQGLSACTPDVGGGGCP